MGQLRPDTQPDDISLFLRSDQTDFLLPVTTFFVRSGVKQTSKKH